MSDHEQPRQHPLAERIASAVTLHSGRETTDEAWSISEAEQIALRQALGMWRDVFGLLVCRNRSRTDNAKVHAFWLAMNQLTGLSRPELMAPDSPWIPADKVRPPLALAPNGQQCVSGWSKWVLACDVSSTMDDIGAEVFPASYSWVLRCWHGVGNTKRWVTHWRDDITAPTPTPDTTPPA